MSKDVEIKARVTNAQKQQLQALADEIGEGLSTILRSAVREYLEKRGLDTGVAKAGEKPVGSRAAKKAAPSKKNSPAEITGLTAAQIRAAKAKLAAAAAADDARAKAGRR